MLTTAAQHFSKAGVGRGLLILYASQTCLLDNSNDAARPCNDVFKEIKGFACARVLGSGIA